MPRFFRRLAEGVFDEADCAAGPTSLPTSSRQPAKPTGWRHPWRSGFSNGANIAAAVLLLRPEALAGAVLLRAMVPLPMRRRAIWRGKAVLLLSGAADPIVPPTTPPGSRRMLKGAGADVHTRCCRSGTACPRPT